MQTAPATTQTPSPAETRAAISELTLLIAERANRLALKSKRERSPAEPR